MGQRKILSPRQESNPWPPKHGVGALSTELRELTIFINVSMMIMLLKKEQAGEGSIPICEITNAIRSTNCELKEDPYAGIRSIPGVDHGFIYEYQTKNVWNLKWQSDHGIY